MNGVTMMHADFIASVLQILTEMGSAK